MLIQLKRRGDWVAVATGKIRESTVRILDHFGLSPWIDRVVCQAHNGRAEKDELIRSALPETYDEVWVVGDRRFDIEGGRALGFHTVGALYGYGSRRSWRPPAASGSRRPRRSCRRSSVPATRCPPARSSAWRAWTAAGRARSWRC